MNVIDLLARLGGEILSNKARAVINGKIVVLARMDGNDWVYTDEGQALANEHSNAAVEEAAAKPKRTKKTSGPAVETQPTQEPSTAVESADIQLDVE
jgi:hypothetical protein